MAGSLFLLRQHFTRARVTRVPVSSKITKVIAITPPMGRPPGRTVAGEQLTAAKETVRQRMRALHSDKTDTQKKSLQG